MWDCVIANETTINQRPETVGFSSCRSLVLLILLINYNSAPNFRYIGSRQMIRAVKSLIIKHAIYSKIQSSIKHYAVSRMLIAGVSQWNNITCLIETMNPYTLICLLNLRVDFPKFPFWRNHYLNLYGTNKN